MTLQTRLKAYFKKKKTGLKKLITLSQKYWNQLLAMPRHEQLLWVFAIEAILVIIFFVPLMVLASYFTIIEKILTTTGVWTLITILISSPIAFFVWKFRDENTIHQLENQRKDVNLKEFQKIAEWVSGLHLVEDKIIEKTKSTEKAAGNHPLGQEQKADEVLDTEISHEYGQAGQSRHIPSHSRQDGAVGLQVAAVYMLKPFYCGEHGEGFRKPALNLLTSAWLALFKQLEKYIKNQSNNQQLDPDSLRNSPLAIALTEVLLADGGIHLRHHRKVFPNLYLPYLNLHLPGLDNEKVLQLFAGLDCRGINLENANLIKIKLNNGRLSNAKLNFAELSGAELNEAYLNLAELKKAKLRGVKLNGAKLNGAKLNGAELIRAELNGAALYIANLNGVELNGVELNNAKLIRATLDGAKLIKAQLGGANLYLANLSNIKIDDFTSYRGAVFDTENIKAIYAHLDAQSLEWVIQVPELAGALIYKKFSFERDKFAYVHELPESLTVEALQKLNPLWTISRVE